MCSRQREREKGVVKLDWALIAKQCSINNLQPRLHPRANDRTKPTRSVKKVNTAMMRVAIKFRCVPISIKGNTATCVVILLFLLYLSIKCLMTIGATSARPV